MKPITPSDLTALALDELSPEAAAELTALLAASPTDATTAEDTRAFCELLSSALATPDAGALTAAQKQAITENLPPTNIVRPTRWPLWTGTAAAAAVVVWLAWPQTVGPRSVVAAQTLKGKVCEAFLIKPDEKTDSPAMVAQQEKIVEEKRLAWLALLNQGVSEITAQPAPAAPAAATMAPKDLSVAYAEAKQAYATALAELYQLRREEAPQTFVSMDSNGGAAPDFLAILRETFVTDQKFENADLITILSYLRSNSESDALGALGFAASSKGMPEGPINIHVHGASLEMILDQACRQIRYGYELQRHTVLVTPRTDGPLVLGYPKAASKQILAASAPLAADPFGQTETAPAPTVAMESKPDHLDGQSDAVAFGRLYKEGLGFYDLGQYNEAKETITKALAIDSKSEQAQKALEQVELAIGRYSSDHQDHTRAKMLAHVDKTWEPAVPRSLLPAVRAALPAPEPAASPNTGYGLAVDVLDVQGIIIHPETSPQVAQADPNASTKAAASEYKRAKGDTAYPGSLQSYLGKELTSLTRELAEASPAPAAPAGMPQLQTAAPADPGVEQLLAKAKPTADQYAREPMWREAEADKNRQERARGFFFQEQKDVTELTAEAYHAPIENPFKLVAAEPLSTFSIDVDTASYANVRRFLNQGQRPPAEAVRVEELINYFRYAYPAPEAGKPCSLTSDLVVCPWNDQHRLARVAVRAQTDEQRPQANLVFLIDVSGSMDRPNKLPLVKQSLHMLVDKLTEKDRVSIVVYAGASGLVLPPTQGDHKHQILAAIDKLSPGGSTNGASGITLAYEQARKDFIKGGVNRVILATDGDFNVGISDPTRLQSLIEKEAKSGVFLSVLGYGMGNLKDHTMETLADKGNGNYAYIDSVAEARKVLSEEMSSTLVTVAKDVKIQIEFNPTKVRAYKLLGYENRMLNKEDFNDDTKDAGEMGAGHTVTALYEITPTTAAPDVDDLKYAAAKPAAAPAPDSPEIMTVKLRYKAPDGDVSQLMTLPVLDQNAVLASAPGDFQFAAAVAAYGLLLRGSQQVGKLDWNLVRSLAKAGKGEDAEGYRGEFLQLLEKAASAAP